jgi:hypothetical protein
LITAMAVLRRFRLPPGVLVPLLGAAVALAWPFARYAIKIRNEATALDVIREVRDAQRAYHGRPGAAGFAGSVAALTTACPDAAAALAASQLTRLSGAGYELILRPRAGARSAGLDCRGEAIVEDYYAGVQPVSAATAAQRAYAATGEGDVFVYFDGVAPLERDMAAGGLATPAAALESFRIP